MKRNYRNRGKWLPVLLGLCVFAIVAAIVISAVGKASEASDKEGLRLAEEAIRKAAVSVYALEGAYPATYEDLKAQSGIAVDEEKYIVQYEIFASNIMPEITVLDRTVFE